MVASASQGSSDAAATDGSSAVPEVTAPRAKEIRVQQQYASGGAPVGNSRLGWASTNDQGVRNRRKTLASLGWQTRTLFG